MDIDAAQVASSAMRRCDKRATRSIAFQIRRCIKAKVPLPFGRPDVLYAFDNLGRMTSRVDSAGTWGWTYDSASSRVLSESLSAPSYTSVVSYTYNPTTFDLASVSFGSHTTIYSWPQGRLTNASWHIGTDLASAQYDYKADSDLLERTFVMGGTVAVFRAYDAASRLVAVSNLNAAGQAIGAFSYTLDAVGRRTVRRDADGSHLSWGYDPFDQLTSASRTNGPNGAVDAAYNYQYQYDLVGNRFHEDRGQTDLDGAFNSLNQIASLNWGGKLDVFGSVGATGVIVKVAGTNAVMYNLTNFLGGAAMKAGSNTIPIVAWLGTNATEMNRTVFMPPAKPQAFLWDRNGNLTNDGQTAYFWNDENRLIAIESLVGVKRRSEYVIDANSRRVETKDLSGWNGSAYVTTNITRFVWDGVLVLAEFAADNSVKAYNVRGLDLSQSLQGAGGIGGLLCSVRNGTNFLYTADGNGNVVDVLTTNGVVAAHYEYSPYGRLTAQSGFFANENPWRFSSQWHERFWRHYRYVYRVYLPDIGWMSRDPVFERGAEQMSVKPRQQVNSLEHDYLSLLNEPTGRIDADGRLSSDKSEECCKEETLTDDQVCAKAFDRPGTMGRVVCYNGKQHLCIYPRGFAKGDPAESVLACVRRHERVHAKDPRTACCPKYRCNQIDVPLARDKECSRGPSQDERECPAWFVTMNCLRGIDPSTPGYSELHQLALDWEKKCGKLWKPLPVPEDGPVAYSR